MSQLLVLAKVRLQLEHFILHLIRVPENEAVQTIIPLLRQLDACYSCSSSSARTTTLCYITKYPSSFVRALALIRPRSMLQSLPPALGHICDLTPFILSPPVSPILSNHILTHPSVRRPPPLRRRLCLRLARDKHSQCIIRHALRRCE
jgi:hypothetical protein